MGKKITITGATGNIGGLVVPSLLEKGAEVTALVRDAAKAAKLKESGVNVVEGDYNNAEAIKTSMQDAESVLVIAPPNPDAVAQNTAIFEAIKATGKPHVVRISAIGAAADAPTENGRFHHKSDEELKNSGLPYTILRPHFFMQNLFMAAETIGSEGQIYMGMKEGKLGMVDVRDIADSAVNILLNGGHLEKIYTPTGTNSITLTEAAKIIGDAIGKEVNYTDVGFDAVKKSIIDMGWGEWGGQIMYDYNKAYSENWGNFTTGDVETITGNKSRSFETFVKEVFAPALSAPATTS